jgi:glycosyltransferase involved in cell wall biosynthesis
MPKKKILFVITKGSPFGGAQRYVYDLATNSPSEFEAVVACGTGDDLPNALTEKRVRVIKIEHLQREIDAKKEFSVFRDLVKIIKEEKPNIVHLNSSKIGALGALAVLYVRVLNLLSFETRTSYVAPRCIFTSHGWGFNELHRPFPARIFYMLSHWVTLILAHRTIAVSHRTKKDVSWMPFVKNRIAVVHNGVGKFKLKTKKEARAILTTSTHQGIEGPALNLGNEKGKKIVIFSLSELHKNKGLDYALNALSRLPKNLREKIIYSIAGAGEEKEALEKLAESLGVKEMVRFLGFVPNAKELLSGADMFLFPSRTENLPYGILEAGFAGLPIIASCIGGIPEIISDMQDGILVHPRQPREIAEAITYLIENPDKTKKFKEKIHEKVLQNFSREKMADATYSLYKSLLPET